MAKKIKNQFAQGDVLFHPIKEIPKGAKKLEPQEKGLYVHAYGEVTGHAHVTDPKLTTMYEWEGNNLIEVHKETELTHFNINTGGKGDHDAIKVAPGTYEVRKQKEFTFEEWRAVRD